MKGGETLKGPLSAEEIDLAEKSWIRPVQAPLTMLSKYEKMKRSLSLYVDDDKLVRCHGRIERSNLPDETKFPVLLPSDHDFTKLVVLKCHVDVMHNGVRETLTQVRSKFWIVRGRQVVKKIISRCLTCKRLEGKSYGVPPAPTSYPGSFFGEGKTLAGAGHVAPRFWVLNCNSTKGGVGEERCITNIDSRTKKYSRDKLESRFFSKLICVVKVDTAQNTIKGVFRYGKNRITVCGQVFSARMRRRPCLVSVFG